MSEEKKTRVFWIRPEGISKVCRHFPAVYTEVDLKYATNREFVLEGIHVIEYSAYQVLQKENAKLREDALNHYRGEFKRMSFDERPETDFRRRFFEYADKALTEYELKLTPTTKESEK